MAHELETLAHGQTAFASARVSAWHRLGTVTEACMSAEEIMAKAFLGGWAVRKIPVFGVDVVNGVEHRIGCDDKRMTVRRNVVTGETEYLGIVGEDYGVVQNEQCAEILDRLVDQVGGAHFETAGSMRRGKSVFVTMKLPEAMRVAGVDNLDLYLVATTSHDGTASARVDATPIRVVCYAVSDMSGYIVPMWVDRRGRCSSLDGSRWLRGLVTRCCQRRTTWMSGWTVTT